MTGRKKLVRLLERRFIVRVPLETAWNRVQERGEVTGRYVPYDFVRGAHEQIAKHQDELMRTADSGYVFDTTVTLGEDPVLLSEYKDGRIVCDKPDR